MNQPALPLKAAAVAEIVQLESGALIIRPRAGRKLNLTSFARTAIQVDGSVILSPVAERIEMGEAMKILGIPYTTLRRIIELGVIIAFKRSPGRWVIDLTSVLEHKTKAENDPEYWDNLKPSESAFQSSLKL